MDYPNAKSMKKNANVCGYIKSIKSVTQTLENVSNTDKIIRNAGKLIASNSNQVIDYIESQVKSKSVAQSEIQKLGNVSNTDIVVTCHNIIMRNAGQLIASNSNQVIDYIESRVKTSVSNLEKTKAPETYISINLLPIAVRTGGNFLPMYESYRQKIANRCGKVWLEVLQPTSILISRIDGILEMGPHSSKTYEVANQIISMQNKSDQEILKILENNMVSEQSPDITGGIYSIGSMFAEPPAYDKLKSSNPQRILSNTSNQETRFSKPQNIDPQNIEPQIIEPQIANTPNSSPGSSFDFVEPYEEVVEAPEFDEDVEIGLVDIASLCFTFENEVGTPEHDSDEEKGPVCCLDLANTPNSSPGLWSHGVFDEATEHDTCDSDEERGPVAYLNRLEVISNIQVNSVRSTSPLLEPSEGTYTTNIVWLVESVFTLR